jgi:hypothetical protein
MAKGSQRIAEVAPFHPLVHRCTNARISLKKCHFVPLLGTVGAPSTPARSLRKWFQSQQIATKMSQPGRSGNLVACEASNCHINFH